MIKRINIFFIFRVLIGLLFIFSGFQKLIGPYQNFLYVIQGYQVFNSQLEEIIARYFPWIEFFLGVFLFLGLWLSVVLRGVIVFFVSFIFILSQALLRKLPVGECGCFGEKFSLPVHFMVFVDCALLAMTLFLFYNLYKTSVFSLDRYYSKSE